ncbi:MAG: alpha/beta hydrolase [Ilumatobacteraceae bacterium]
MSGTTEPTTTEMLVHNHVELALHTLRAGSGRPLLLLHGLGERSPAVAPVAIAAWPGPVAALDFTGHGGSTMPIGGGYTAEILLADADAALERLGEVTIVGRGLGAYIGLLLAGARADSVRGTVIADGPGLSGGPSVPTSQPVFSFDAVATPPDPYALAELGRDLRPPDYATTFARLAVQGSGLHEPISVVARFRPSWLRAVVDEPGVTDADSVADALARYAG